MPSKGTDGECLARALKALAQIEPGLEGRIRNELNAGRELSEDEAKYLPKEPWRARFTTMDDYLK